MRHTTSFLHSPPMFGNIQKLKQANPEKNLENAGKPWSDENVTKLLADVQKKKTHEEMAELHGRTVGGIRSRLKVIAVDYYSNNNMSISEIEKYTGLSAEVIVDAISRREYLDELAEKKKEGKANPPLTQSPKRQTLIEDSMAFQQKDGYHDTLKELLVVAKDIQRMMKDFHADNFVTKTN